MHLADLVDFEAAGHRYVLVVETGALLELDQVAGSVVNFLRTESRVIDWEIAAALSGKFPAEQVAESVDELMGMGIVRQAAANQAVISQAGKGQGNPSLNFPLQTLVFNLAHDCNLKCRYCYAEGGNYGGGRELMSPEVARQAVDFLLQEAADRKELQITLFGGEPLLNFPVIKATVAYARQACGEQGKAVSFSLTTNGTLLTDEVIDFLIEESIGVSVSMDGPPEIHDHWRPLPGGGGSYHLLYPKVKRLLAQRGPRPVGARVTLAKGMGDLRQILQHLLSLGFHEVGFAPVTSCQGDIALSEQENGRLLEVFEELALEYVAKALQGEYLGFSNLSNLLGEIHHGDLRTYPCGAGIGFLAVSPTGNLFLCHRFTENQEQLMGDVVTGINPAARSRLLEEGYLGRKNECQSCSIRHFCAGGCYYEAQVRQGDWRRPNRHYCTWQKRWLEIGLKSYVTIMENNPGFFHRLFGHKVDC